MTDRVGQQLGHYRLTRLLGRGGFAEVYLGEHLRLKTQAAIKVLHTALEEDDEEGFLREAQTVARLKHPHIVRVFDFDVENHTPFLVMDYLPNGNIRRSHPKGSLLPLPTIVSYVNQVASALQYAHDEKLIHRDIKPENMLLDRGDTVVLSDFGIALMAQSSRYQSTQEVAGTAAYMAPEQFQGKPRRASDQYALGVVVYEWLAGDRPFHGSFSEIASQHLFVPPPPLHEKVSTILPAVERVVLTALEKDPEKRFANVQAFATAFEQACQADQPHSSILSQAPTVASQPLQPLTMTSPAIPLSQQTITSTSSSVLHTVPALPDQPQQTPDTSGTLKPKPSHQGISRRTVVMGLAGLAVVGVAGGGLLLLTRSQQPAAPTVLVSPTAPPTSLPTPIPSTTTIYTYRGHSDEVRSVAWSPDGTKIASGSGYDYPGFGTDNTVQVWEATTGKLLVDYKGHSGGVISVAWSPDGTKIASGSADNTVQVWEATTGRLLYTYRGHSNFVTSVAWSPDGTKIASGSGDDGTANPIDNTVQVFEAATGNRLIDYTGHSNSLESVAWSPDGSKIASGSNDNTVQVWEATTGKLLYTYRGHSAYVLSVAWSPDGKKIASGGFDGTVQIWEAATGNRLIDYTRHSDKVDSVAWSPDGKYIASGSDDITVQVFEAATGNRLIDYTRHFAKVLSVAWSPDRKYIASGSADKTVQVWQAE